MNDRRKYDHPLAGKAAVDKARAQLDQLFGESVQVPTDHQQQYANQVQGVLSFSGGSGLYDWYGREKMLDGRPKPLASEPIAKLQTKAREVAQKQIAVRPKPKRKPTFKLTRREVETVNAHITTGIVKVLPEKLSKWEFVKVLSDAEITELSDRVENVGADEECRELFVDEPLGPLSEPDGEFRESELVNSLRSQVWVQLLSEGFRREDGQLNTLKMNSLGRSAARDWLRAYGTSNETGVYKNRIVGKPNSETTVLDDGDHESNETVTDSWDVMRLETSGFFSQGLDGLEEHIQKMLADYEHDLRVNAMNALKAANPEDHAFIRAYYTCKRRTTAKDRQRVVRIKDWLRAMYPDAFCIRKVRKERSDRKTQ